MDDSLNKEVARICSFLKTEKGVKYREIANTIGFNEAYLWRIRHAKCPSSVAHIVALCTRYGWGYTYTETQKGRHIKVNLTI